MDKGIIILGEAFIDFLAVDSTNLIYKKSAGGAPANVALGTAGLGASSTLITKVGNDTLGNFLINTLRTNNVNINFIKNTADAKTNIAIINLDKSGEKTLELYTQPSTSQLLNENDIIEEAFKHKKIFHFDSSTLLHVLSLAATRKAIDIAQKQGLIISFNPNIVFSLIKDKKYFKNIILSLLHKVQILNVSEEELYFITEENTIKKATSFLSTTFNIKIVYITTDASGCYVYTKNILKFIKNTKVTPIKMINTKYWFVCTILYNINKLDTNIESINVDLAAKFTCFENEADKQPTTTKGTMPAPATLEDTKKRVLLLQSSNPEEMDKFFRNEICKNIGLHGNFVESDKYRQKYHIMPPIGLLNDPNGFIQFRGEYHLFFQWSPFSTKHKEKFWGHYISEDLVNWQLKPVALTPTNWFDKNGCYSGSAIEYKDNIILFYTGNVKNYKGNRESYQCMAKSKDGINFFKSGVVIDSPPEGYTTDFRDPKVWKHNGKWYMVIGAKNINKQGSIVLYESTNLKQWLFKGSIMQSGNKVLGYLGYMWECPDLFTLDNKDVLLFSPQGVMEEGLLYQNKYQTGYVVGKLDYSTYEFTHGVFYEIDRGFEFYAPQTTLDKNGRRIMFGWMGVPEQGEDLHPTHKYKWIHNMTIPRELILKDDKLCQYPISELKKMRKNKFNKKINIDSDTNESLSLTSMANEIFIQILNPHNLSDLTINFFNNYAFLIYDSNLNLLTLKRQCIKNNFTEKRQCYLNKLQYIHLFIDSSSLEIFINNGEEVFTSRIFPDHHNIVLKFLSNHKIELDITKWDL